MTDRTAPPADRVVPPAADGAVPPPTGADYADEAVATVRRVATAQADAVSAAADLITAALRAGGIVQAFGTGHSQALSMEIAGRAGGLVPTNMLALRDVVLFGGAPPETLLDPYLERDPAVAARVYALADVDPRDVFVIGSNSGGNGAVVEMARIARANGHRLVAVTSLAHATTAASRHPSGLLLHELADVVLDNGAPHGDAALPAGPVTVGAVSSITAALLAQMVVTEVVARLLAAGEDPPVYRSANVAGGDAHNTALEARYAGRIRRPA